MASSPRSKKDRSSAARASKYLPVLLLVALAACCLYFFPDTFSGPSAALQATWDQATRPSGGADLSTPEARRLLALLTSAAALADKAPNEPLAASTAQAASQLSVDPTSPEAPILVALGEKTAKCQAALIKCQTDVANCQADLEKSQAELEKGKAELEKGKAACSEDPKRATQKLQKENKRLQGMVKQLEQKLKAAEAEAAKAASSSLDSKSKAGGSEAQAASDQVEVLKLKSEVEKLKKDLEEQQKKSATAAGVLPGGTDADIMLTSLKGETQKLRGSLEETKKGWEREVGELKRKLLEAESAAAVGQSGGDSSAALTGYGFDKDSEKHALDAAKKYLEDCGAKQGMPNMPKDSYLYKCEATQEELAQYLNYKPREQCPDDWYFVQKLVYLKNCHCLPRRTCFAPSPPAYQEPSIPFPESLFDPRVLKNENVRWTKQYWPNFEALNNRTWGDCRDCFNLTLENYRWEHKFQGTIPMDYMLALKPKGSIKIGLDAGGGTGSFAAKMAQRGVTIVTTAMNTETLGGEKEGGLPYMETIAQRGLIPLFVPHKARQPFMDGTLDIVHNINSIKYFTIPEFEELLFEWDRILRPGGVMWFELFYTPVAEMPMYISVIDMFGYKRLYWNMTPKTDAPEKDGAHVYLNCVLEKPRRPDVPPVIESVGLAQSQ